MSLPAPVACWNATIVPSGEKEMLPELSGSRSGEVRRVRASTIVMPPPRRWTARNREFPDHATGSPEIPAVLGVPPAVEMRRRSVGYARGPAVYATQVPSGERSGLVPTAKRRGAPLPGDAA